MILVTGATGNAGSQVVRALAERGEAVRCFARDSEKARRLLGDAVELAVGDFADEDSFYGALEGVDRLVLSCATIRAGSSGRRRRSTRRRPPACAGS